MRCAVSMSRFAGVLPWSRFRWPISRIALTTVRPATTTSQPRARRARHETSWVLVEAGWPYLREAGHLLPLAFARGLLLARLLRGQQLGMRLAEPALAFAGGQRLGGRQARGGGVKSSPHFGHQRSSPLRASPQRTHAPSTD